MRFLLRKCTKCGEYTLRQDKCPYCGGPLRNPHPAKFSPEDRYGKYRRELKKLLLKEGKIKL
ncbi:MAG: RNA-protein complex protein Nop10 [Thermoprotei archaeon]|nr:MAG: RNA-protein complex protein Nop10 [Thermoprotei archaeon]RLF19195.1 MAG: RNA-protein complex protein Nop10 [Thermoprotei archaeon]